MYRHTGRAVGLVCHTHKHTACQKSSRVGGDLHSRFLSSHTSAVVVESRIAQENVKTHKSWERVLKIIRVCSMKPISTSEAGERDREIGGQIDTF